MVSRKYSKYRSCRIDRRFCRVATYSKDPNAQSAGTALDQLQLAASAGVLYLDKGWQTIVDSLMTEAQKAKVDVVTSKRIEI